MPAKGPSAGHVVGGRYRLVRPLGEGGMASVWAAEHLGMGNIVALKLISPELVRHPIAIARFKREARAAAKLRSPYVVQLFDHDIDPELGPYIAMELLEGESLAERMDREHLLAPTELARIMVQVGKGLSRAHAAGIVHRDMKPDNIFLVCDDDGNEVAKMLDFGVAKADSPLGAADGRTAAGTLVGTIHYMSPEQAQGKEVDHLADLWALSIIAFEALVGRRPFEAEATGALLLEICVGMIPVPSSLNPTVPLGFDEWFERATEREPVDRFQSAQELTKALAAVCDPDRGVSLEVTTGPAAMARPPRPKPTRPAAPPPPRSSRPAVPFAPPAPARAPVSPADRAAPEPQPDTFAPESKSGSHKKKRVLQIVPSILPPKPDNPRLQLIPSDRPSAAPASGAPSAPPPRGYYVMEGNQTVGPVQQAALEQAFAAGRISPAALVWIHPWTAWKRVDQVVWAAPKQRTTVPTSPMRLEKLGPSCALPPNAPPLKLDPGSRTLPAPARSASPVEPNPECPATSGSSRVERQYFVTRSGQCVGPVQASILRRGIEAGRVPWSALIWRDGWDRWKSPMEAMSEIRAWEPAPAELLRDFPGIEAVGPVSLPPPGAPPSGTPGRRGRSK